MFKSSYKVATILGIPIKIHISLIVMVIILMMDYGPLRGILIEIGLAVSIVLHELAHSFVAIRKGCHVRQITLMLLGGVAQMERLPSRPLDEFLMALAGPAVSLVLGIAGVYAGMVFPLPPKIGNYSFILILGAINIFLAGFNLLPSFPMDGGRIFRAILTPKFGRLKATHIAARLGQIMAILFGIWGLFPPTNWILVFIAVFIFTSAGREYRMVQMQEAMKQRGYGFGEWPPFQSPYSDDDGRDDQVLIGPPPYEKRPEERSDIQSEDDTPFRNMFGQ